jgi:hypothetical protein
MLAFMFSAPPLLILLPILHIYGRQNELPIGVRTLLSIGILNIPLTLGFILLTDGMYRALYRAPSSRSWRQAAVHGLLSLTFFPAIAFLWCWSLTGNPALSCAQVRLACCFAPLAPLLFALMARQAADQQRDYEEWASLDVEE